MPLFGNTDAGFKLNKINEIALYVEDLKYFICSKVKRVRGDSLCLKIQLLYLRVFN